LAFEEIGKAQHYELSIEREKKTIGWHQYRQILSCYVLFLSLMEKYGVQLPKLSPSTRATVEARWGQLKKAEEIVSAPVPQEFYEETFPQMQEQLQRLSEDQKIVSSVELRWIRKIFEAALTGEMERTRQRGMYVDIADGKISSDPAGVSREVAYFWLRVSERALRLLEFGDFEGPYGDLAALLEALPKPLPERAELIRTLNDALSKLKDDAAATAPRT